MTSAPARALRGVLIVCLVCAFAAIASSARAQTATATLDGSVVDQSGAVLPGVTITIVNTSTAVSRSVVSDANGLFSAPLLPVGTYDLTAELQGFATRKQAAVPL